MLVISFHDKWSMKVIMFLSSTIMQFVTGCVFIQWSSYLSVVIFYPPGF